MVQHTPSNRFRRMCCGTGAAVVLLLCICAAALANVVVVNAQTCVDDTTVLTYVQQTNWCYKNCADNPYYQQCCTNKAISFSTGGKGDYRVIIRGLACNTGSGSACGGSSDICSCDGTLQNPTSPTQKQGYVGITAATVCPQNNIAESEGNRALNDPRNNNPPERALLYTNLSAETSALFFYRTDCFGGDDISHSKIYIKNITGFPDIFKCNKDDGTLVISNLVQRRIYIDVAGSSCDVRISNVETESIDFVDNVAGGSIDIRNVTCHGDRFSGSSGDPPITTGCIRFDTSVTRLRSIYMENITQRNPEPSGENYCGYSLVRHTGSVDQIGTYTIKNCHLIVGNNVTDKGGESPVKIQFGSSSSVTVSMVLLTLKNTFSGSTLTVEDSSIAAGIELVDSDSGETTFASFQGAVSNNKRISFVRCRVDSSMFTWAGQAVVYLAHFREAVDSVETFSFSDCVVVADVAVANSGSMSVSTQVSLARFVKTVRSTLDFVSLNNNVRVSFSRKTLVAVDAIVFHFLDEVSTVVTFSAKNTNLHLAKFNKDSTSPSVSLKCISFDNGFVKVTSMSVTDSKLSINSLDAKLNEIAVLKLYMFSVNRLSSARGAQVSQVDALTLTGLVLDFSISAFSKECAVEFRVLSIASDSTRMFAAKRFLVSEIHVSASVLTQSSIEGIPVCAKDNVMMSVDEFFVIDNIQLTGMCTSMGTLPGHTAVLMMMAFDEGVIFSSPLPSNVHSQTFSVTNVVADLSVLRAQRTSTIFTCWRGFVTEDTEIKSSLSNLKLKVVFRSLALRIKYSVASSNGGVSVFMLSWYGASSIAELVMDNITVGSGSNIGTMSSSSTGAVTLIFAGIRFPKSMTISKKATFSNWELSMPIISTNRGSLYMYAIWMNPNLDFNVTDLVVENITVLVSNQISGDDMNDGLITAFHLASRPARCFDDAMVVSSSSSSPSSQRQVVPKCTMTFSNIRVAIRIVKVQRPTLKLLNFATQVKNVVMSVTNVSIAENTRVHGTAGGSPAAVACALVHFTLRVSNVVFSLRGGDVPFLHVTSEAAASSGGASVHAVLVDDTWQYGSITMENVRVVVANNTVVTGANSKVMGLSVKGGDGPEQLSQILLENVHLDLVRSFNGLSMKVSVVDIDDADFKSESLVVESSSATVRAATDVLGDLQVAIARIRKGLSHRFSRQVMLRDCKVSVSNVSFSPFAKLSATFAVALIELPVVKDDSSSVSPPYFTTTTTTSPDPAAPSSSLQQQLPSVSITDGSVVVANVQGMIMQIFAVYTPTSAPKLAPDLFAKALTLNRVRVSVSEVNATSSAYPVVVMIVIFVSAIHPSCETVFNLSSSELSVVRLTATTSQVWAFTALVYPWGEISFRDFVLRDVSLTVSEIELGMNIAAQALAVLVYPIKVSGVLRFENVAVSGTSVGGGGDGGEHAESIAFVLARITKPKVHELVLLNSSVFSSQMPAAAQRLVVIENSNFFDGFVNNVTVRESVVVVAGRDETSVSVHVDIVQLLGIVPSFIEITRCRIVVPVLSSSLNEAPSAWPFLPVNSKNLTQLLLQSAASPPGGQPVGGGGGGGPLPTTKTVPKDYEVLATILYIQNTDRDPVFRLATCVLSHNEMSFDYDALSKVIVDPSTGQPLTDVVVVPPEATPLYRPTCTPSACYAVMFATNNSNVFGGTVNLTGNSMQALASLVAQHPHDSATLVVSPELIAHGAGFVKDSFSLVIASNSMVTKAAMMRSAKILHPNSANFSLNGGILDWRCNEDIPRPLQTSMFISLSSSTSRAEGAAVIIHNNCPGTPTTSPSLSQKESPTITERATPTRTKSHSKTNPTWQTLPSPSVGSPTVTGSLATKSGTETAHFVAAVEQQQETAGQLAASASAIVAGAFAAMPAESALVANGLVALSLMDGCPTSDTVVEKKNVYYHDRLEFPFSLFPGWRVGSDPGGAYLRGALLSYILLFCFVVAGSSALGVVGKGKFEQYLLRQKEQEEQQQELKKNNKREKEHQEAGGPSEELLLEPDDNGTNDDDNDVDDDDDDDDGALLFGAVAGRSKKRDPRRAEQEKQLRRKRAVAATMSKYSIFAFAPIVSFPLNFFVAFSYQIGHLSGIDLGVNAGRNNAPSGFTIAFLVLICGWLSMAIFLLSWVVSAGADRPLVIRATLYWPSSPPSALQRQARDLLLAPISRLLFIPHFGWSVPSKKKKRDLDHLPPPSGPIAQLGTIMSKTRGPRLKSNGVHVERGWRNQLSPFFVIFNFVVSIVLTILKGAALVNPALCDSARIVVFVVSVIMLLVTLALRPFLLPLQTILLITAQGFTVVVALLALPGVLSSSSSSSSSPLGDGGGDDKEKISNARTILGTIFTVLMTIIMLRKIATRGLRFLSGQSVIVSVKAKQRHIKSLVEKIRLVPARAESSRQQQQQEEKDGRRSSSWSPPTTLSAAFREEERYFSSSGDDDDGNGNGGGYARTQLHESEIQQQHKFHPHREEEMEEMRQTLLSPAAAAAAAVGSAASSPLSSSPPSAPSPPRAAVPVSVVPSLIAGGVGANAIVDELTSVENQLQQRQQQKRKKHK